MLSIVDREKEEIIENIVDWFSEYTTIEVTCFRNILNNVYEKGRAAGIRKSLIDSFYLVEAHKLNNPGVIDTRIIHNNGVVERIKESLQVRLKDLFYGQ